MKRLFYSRRKRIIGREEQNKSRTVGLVICASSRFAKPGKSNFISIEQRMQFNGNAMICIISRHRNIPRRSDSTTIVIDKESIDTFVFSSNHMKPRKIIEHEQNRLSRCSFSSASLMKLKEVGYLIYKVSQNPYP